MNGGQGSIKKWFASNQRGYFTIEASIIFPITIIILIALIYFSQTIFFDITEAYSDFLYEEDTPIQGNEVVRITDILKIYGNSFFQQKSLAEGPLEEGCANRKAFISEEEAIQCLYKNGERNRQFILTIGGKKRERYANVFHEGVIHEINVGYIAGTDAKRKISKDYELIKSGQIKGAVWHFYAREGKERNGPSRFVLKELREKGILYHIHY